MTQNHRKRAGVQGEAGIANIYKMQTTVFPLMQSHCPCPPSTYPNWEIPVLNTEPKTKQQDK